MFPYEDCPREARKKGQCELATTMKYLLSFRDIDTGADDVFFRLSRLNDLLIGIGVEREERRECVECVGGYSVLEGKKLE